MKAFFCYEIYFLKVNIYNKFIEDDNNNYYLQNETLKIIQPDLIGIDLIWNLFNYSEIKQVSDKA